MTSAHHTLLDHAKKIPSESVRWHFVSEYWDGPVSGLAIYRDRVHRFCCFQEDIPNQNIFVLHELTSAELTEEERVKAKFERMVGTHGSFEDNGNPKPRFLADQASINKFYQEEATWHQAPQPLPTDRPVVAWFDISEKKKPTQSPEPMPLKRHGSP